MNLRGLQVRIERLQRQESGLCVSVWDILFKPMEELAPEQQDYARLLYEEANAALAAALEESVVGIGIRREYERLGMPQPPTLLDLDDPIEELLRLVALPDPTAPVPCGLKEISATKES